MDDLERIELSAVRDLFAAAPADVTEAFALAVLELDGATAFSIGALQNQLLFNRVLGLESDAPLPELESWFGSRECSFAISLRPGAELESVLAARGYRRGNTLMKFKRGIDPPPEDETSLRIERVGRGRAGAFGAVLAAVFDFGSPMDRWFAALCTRSGWLCFGAFDGDRLVATAATHVAGGLAWLGAAATLPEARRRGAQSALLAARIRAAAEAGARRLCVETGNRDAGELPSSFRNVVRAGFEEAYVQQWWLPPD
jgi:GNAT superfamily N-acetyltransferase